MRITRFEDIQAWQAAREVAQIPYKITRNGSFATDYALRDQIDRAAGSAMDNVAEGFDAGTGPEFIRFLSYAQQSCSEVQSQLYRALDRGHIDQRVFADLYQQVKEAYARIGGFIKYLKSDQVSSRNRQGRSGKGTSDSAARTRDIPN